MRHVSTLVCGVLIVAGIILLPLSAIAAQTTTTPATACPGAPVPRLSPGMTARPAQSFSTLWADLQSTNILTVMFRADGDTFSVVQGPSCAGGPFNWYQVNFNGMLGWVTEGTGDTYWVEPVSGTPPPTPIIIPTVFPTPFPTPFGTLSPDDLCLTAPSPRLTVGELAQPAQSFSSLRDAFQSNNILYVMMRTAGDTFTILSGPQCGAAGVYWYQVNYKGMVGWVTEGADGVYWVEPVSTTGQ